MSAIRALDARLTAWLTAAEPNAAGNMGIFRILYATFFLWHVAHNSVVLVSGYSVFGHMPVALLDAMPALQRTTLLAAESALVGALVLLAMGLFTRWTTAAVLLLGALHEMVATSVNPELANVLLTAFIPATMLLVGRWGDTFSLDALRRRTRGLSVPDPARTSPRDVLAMHVLLVVLVFLMTSSGIAKIAAAGGWFSEPGHVIRLMLSANVNSALQGIPTLPLAAALAHVPRVADGIGVGLVVFEAAFWLALLHRRLRAIMLSGALVFHAFSALFVDVTFTPVLVVYGLFIDWYGLARRLVQARLPLPSVRPLAVPSLAVVLAAAAAVAWHRGLDTVMATGGVVDWRTVWLPVLPVALVVLVHQTVLGMREVSAAVVSRFRPLPSRDRMTSGRPL